MEDLDQLLADLQNVSQRARTAYEGTESETRLEPMVLNRTLPSHRHDTLNLTRPDSVIGPTSPPPPSSSKSLNELNQLLEALSKAKQTMKKDVQPTIPRASSLTPSTSMSNLDNPSTKTTKSIDDLIESLNDIPETIKSGSKKKSSSSKQAKNPTATKELEDLMTSLSDFKLPQETSSPITRAPPRPASSSETLPRPIDHRQYPLCHACQQPIIGQVITVLDRSYHPEHLRCTACDVEIGRRDFYEKSGKPYCEHDYRRLFAPRCARCDQPIIDVMITALNQNWHPEHFVCELCQRRVGEDGYHEKNGQAYCRECYLNNFVPKCLGCKQTIVDTYIQALGGHYHRNCFVCQECSQPFLTGSFYEHDRQPLCEIHYHQRRGSLCSSCQKPIGGRCITAMGRKYHVEHFICAYCTRQLHNGTFKEYQDKPYCHPCFLKLFA